MTATTKRLRVSPELTLPDDAVTQTFVVFGKRGSGKSNTAVVLAEEMHRAGGQIIVLDPIGAWWGLKSSFDGAGPGLPVYIFGGQHGDLPLQSTKGELMAQVAIAHRIPMVLDMKGWAGAERARFVTAFAKWLLDHNDRTPVHVFLEEADAFIPQHPYKGEEEMLGAMDRLIRWGRQEGIGATAITQRSAKINKDVTTQAEVLIAHRTIGPQDVAAIREWIKYHAAGDEQQQVLSSLPTLPDGTAWVWSPDWLDLLQRIPFRRRETFDSASTPKLGEKRIQPKQLAPVDVEQLRDQLETTIEEAKANDPAELRRQIVLLKRQLEQRPVERSVETITEQVRAEVPILTDAQMAELRTLAGNVHEHGWELINAVGFLTNSLSVHAASRSAQQATTPTSTVRRTAARSEAPLDPGVAQSVERRGAGLATAGATGSNPVSGANGGASLGKAERQILAVLAGQPLGLSREALAFLAGYHPRTPGFSNALGALRSAGYITQGVPSIITDEGRSAAAAAQITPMATPPLDEWLSRLEEVERGTFASLAPVYPAEIEGWRLDAWVSRLGKAERTIMEILLAEHPTVLDRTTLAERAGYHPRTPGFSNALGRLRGLGLVIDTGLSPEFARMIGR